MTRLKIRARLDRINARASAIAHARRTRRVAIGVAITIVVYGLLGFIALPMILRHVVTGQVATSLHRPVSVGKIVFNPYTLRLQVDDLRVGEREGAQAFAGLGHLDVKVSWTSLFRLAPVIGEVKLERPQVHVVRVAENRFNFSDLIAPSASPKPPPGKPTRFAVSNIQLHQGSVLFDDQVTGQQHKIEKIELDVPFVANLPADVNIYVQPLLAMVIDGSPLRVAGKGRPFNAEPESIMQVNLRDLKLSQYLAYVPRKLPVKLPQGTLSAHLLVHFVNAFAGPAIRIGGAVTLDQIDLRDAADAPLLALKSAVVNLDDVDTLQNFAHVGAITLDGLETYVVRNADGTTNLTPLTAANPPAATSVPARASSPQASPIPQGTTAAPAPPVKAAIVAAKVAPSARPAPAIATPVIAPPSPVATVSAAMPIASASASMTPAAASTAASLAPSIMETAPTKTASGGTATSGTSGAFNLILDSFALTNGAVHLTDHSAAVATTANLQAIHATLTNLRTAPQSPPAPFAVAGTLSGGGSVAIKGVLNLLQSQVTTDLTLAQIDVPALQGFAQTFLAAKIATGKLNVQASVATQFAAGKFNVHVEPATLALDDFDIRPPGAHQPPITWKTIAATIGQVDLASHQATVTELRTDSIHLSVLRDRKGALSLASLIRKPGEPPGAASAPENRPARRPAREAHSRAEMARAERARRAAERAAYRTQEERRLAARTHGGIRAAAKPATPVVSPTPPAGGWQYKIAAVTLEKSAIAIEDHTVARPVKIGVAPLNIRLKDVTSDFAKPFSLELDGTADKTGTFAIDGTAAIEPLKADLRVTTRRLDVAPATLYAQSNLNATITSAALTTKGAVALADPGGKLRVSYRGDATLTNVRVLDKLTSDLFLRWNALSVHRIDFRMGEGQPRIHIGAIALDDFYTRLILNADGHLNVSDITSSARQAPTSLTRPGAKPLPAPSAPSAPAPGPSEAGAPSAQTSATATPAAALPPPTPHPIAADIAIGQIGLRGGHVNYTDNFIKPNYTADLTAIAGHVGEFGTRSTAPADVNLDGLINGNAPISIQGSINPLAPMAAVDIKAKATQIELTDLTAYSSKYTGYPITRGKLSVDVHYVLDHDLLTAQNHILLDQLTFGDKVETPGAMNLPLRLAVAILKDSKGQISLDLPVSGSLADPQFSLGGIIWHAMVSLLLKAVTSPFRLLAAALPGGGNSGQDLSYVEFTPGFATLPPASRQKLDSVAAALKQRPSLKLSIAGVADPALDRPGLHDAKLYDLIKAAKIHDLGGAAAGIDPDTVSVGPDDYAKYLKRVYKAAKFDKPLDVLGMNKSLPPDEMKKLLIKNMQVSDKDLATLADARAAAVRKYMSKRIDPARLAVAAPNLTAAGITDKGPATRVALSLE
ncbi:MAG: DUF748 domain-containing protein [Candidatus Binataceae bacterium]|nr:DUF748 domain-containing protein [Candidatus Binataceae bacterium]